MTTRYRTSSTEDLPSYDAVWEQNGQRDRPRGDGRGASAGDDSRPLPFGWVKEWDQTHNRWFYVDVRANPPRSTWDHPLDTENPSSSSSTTPSARAANKTNKSGKKGFFSKIKDEIAQARIEHERRTEAERQAATERYRQQAARQQEQLRNRPATLQRQYSAPGSYGYGYGRGPSAFGGPCGGGFGRGGPFGGRQYYGGQQYGGGPFGQQRGGFGGNGGGLALPLIGGLAGGLLLGDLLDGGGGFF